MSVFERNEELLEKLEEAESRVEKIRIEGADSADSVEKSELAAEIKSYVVELASNVDACGGDTQKLGGALVIPDLLEVLKRYREVFEVEGLDALVDSLESMWENAG